MHRRARLLIILTLLLVAGRAAGEVLRVEITSRERVLQGRSFGRYGPYELVRGRIYFGFDPANAENARIVDIALAPRARHLDGRPIRGLVRSDWTVDETVRTLYVGHRNQLAYPVLDFNDPANVLTERDGRDAPHHIVPRSAWQFAREENGRVVPDSTHVYLPSGFQAGKIYELVYRAQEPAVVGLGLAAIRDVIAYAKHDTAAAFPVRYGVAAGVSQTGRFLRHFLYQGFNTDEAGRPAYDGLMIITAGAGRGSFNHRFAQPSRDAHRYSAFFYPTDLFPFTSRPVFDSLQWRTDGLLSHLENPAHAPRTFYINTGYEYWGRAASLIHTMPDGRADVAPLPNERIYHVSGGQHFVGGFPPPARSRMGAGPAYRGDPLDYSGTYRAMLVRLVAWVADDVAPPPSVYPHKADGTLVPIDSVEFPAIPGVAFPRHIHVAYRADYGPRWGQGIIDIQPPRVGEPFPSQVAQVDSLGNELAGVESVELQVPLATYAPWNLRVGAPGGPDELTDFLGTFIPLPRTEAERTRTGDPRPSIASLYRDRADYLRRIGQAMDSLVQAGFLLPDDRDHVRKRAMQYWEWIQRQGN